MARGMVIDVDHMSARTRSAVFDMVEEAGYPVVAGHAEFHAPSRHHLRSERQLTPAELLRIAESGGVVAPLLRQTTVDLPPALQGSSEGFLMAFRHLLSIAPRSCGGFGTDLNGFAGLPRPSGRADSSHVEYPIAAPVGGAPMGRAVLGERVFDIDRDGVAHAGMLPDFFAELRAAGAAEDELGPLLDSASRYVDVWEQALAAA